MLHGWCNILCYVQYTCICKGYTRVCKVYTASTYFGLEYEIIQKLYMHVDDHLVYVKDIVCLCDDCGLNNTSMQNTSIGFECTGFVFTPTLLSDVLGGPRGPSSVFCRILHGLTASQIFSKNRSSLSTSTSKGFGRGHKWYAAVCAH